MTDYQYTVDKSVDESLAGVPAKIILMFEEGSAMEVKADQIISIGRTLNFASAPYINIEYDEGRRSCDCYGDVTKAIAFSLTCYEPDDDMIWRAEESKRFDSWYSVLDFFLTHHRTQIEMIEAIYEGEKNA